MFGHLNLYSRFGFLRQVGTVAVAVSVEAVFFRSCPSGCVAFQCHRDGFELWQVAKHADPAPRGGNTALIRAGDVELGWTSESIRIAIRCVRTHKKH